MVIIVVDVSPRQPLKQEIIGGTAPSPYQQQETSPKFSGAVRTLHLL